MNKKYTRRFKWHAMPDGGCDQLAILHCVSGYPAPAADYNLRAIPGMINRFGVVTGLSDHTLDNTTAVAGIAMGASIVEKHFTLDRNGGGPDDSFSLEPHELKALCRDTYTAWQALGKIANEFDTKPFATYEEAESQIFDYGEDDLK